MFSNYLKVALRNLLRHKGYSAINILGLAVGMAACIVILLWVRFNLSFDSFHANADRVCWLYEHQDFAGEGARYVSSTMPAAGPALQQDYPEVEHFCRLYPSRSGFIARRGEQLLDIKQAFYADSALLRIFSFPLLAGDPATALQRPNSLVLSREMALRLFGDQDPLGQVVIREGESYTVTGVLNKLPRNTHLQFEALISFSSLEYRQPWGENNSWRRNCLITYLLLEPGTDRLALERKLPDFLQKNLGGEASNFKLLLMPVPEMRLHSPVGYGKGPDKLQLLLFTGLALTVLLLACINFINLSTARSGRRAQEVGLRKALGASRPVIARQFLGESVLLAALALLVAIALVELALPQLNSRMGIGLEFNYLSDWPLSLSLLTSTLAVGLLAGVYPAMVVSSFRPSAVLKGDTTDGPGRRWLRRSLVFAQFAVSLLLITCTLVVYGQWKYMRSKELGLNTSQVICLPRNPEMPDRYETFRQSLSGNQAVEAITATGYPLWAETWTANFRYEGDGYKSLDEAWLAAFMDVDYDFISFFGLELVAGRGFSRERATDRVTYVINETMAAKLGCSAQEAVGRQVSLGDDQYGPVLGVVKDFHFRSVVQPIEPLALMPSSTMLNSVMLRTKPGQLRSAVGQIEKQWQAFFPDRPFEFTFLDQEFARKYESYEQQTLIIGFFTLLAVLLAGLGLLGLIALAAESRTKEIGVRKVLGATVADILLLLSREFLLLLAAAMLIAWPVAWYLMHRWLQNFAYRIELDWLTFLAGGLIALTVAALTVGWQVLRAATTDPVKSLRYE